MEGHCHGSNELASNTTRAERAALSRWNVSALRIQFVGIWAGYERLSQLFIRLHTQWLDAYRLLTNL